MPEITQASENRIENAVSSYGATIFRVCLALLGNKPDAEDATQETFLRYVRQAPPFRDSEHEKAWLIRVAVNHCRNMRRYLLRHPQTGLPQWVELGVEQQYWGLLDACTETANVAPRRKRLPWAIAIAAVALLLLAGGAMLPRLSPAPHSFTITAYALDAGGETVSAELSAEAVSFNFDLASYSGIASNLSSYGAGSSGEIYTGMSFSCAGKNISSITYTAEGCRFAENIVLTDWEEHINNHDMDWAIRENIMQVTWAGDTGTAIRSLGESYTVDYANQQEGNYLLHTPLYTVEEDYNGDYPVLLTQEERVPSGIMSSVKNERYVTRKYIAKEAYIMVTVTFTDGTEQQKRLLLTPHVEGVAYESSEPRKAEYAGYSIRVEVLE